MICVPAFRQRDRIVDDDSPLDILPMKKLALMFALCVGGPGLAAESIPWAADIPTSVAEKIREDCAAKAADNYPLRATCIRWAGQRLAHQGGAGGEMTERYEKTQQG